MFEWRAKVRANPFVGHAGLVGEYRGQYGAKHRVLVTERGPWHLCEIHVYADQLTAIGDNGMAIKEQP